MTALSTVDPGNAAAGQPPAWHEEATGADAIASFLVHPRSPEAIRTCLHAILALYRGDRVLNLLANDRGRLVTANCALWLHFSGRPDDPGSGLTARRLRDLIAAEEVASRGRVTALIALMQWAGYIAREGGGGSRRLVATGKLIELHVDRWRALLEAATIVLPDLRAAVQVLSDPGFIAAYTRHQAEAYRHGIRLMHAAPELRPFGERNAGLLILCKLTEAALGSRDQAAVSVSALARQFHVSRPHVIELLRAAETLGLVTRTPDGARAATKSLIASLERWSAALLLLNAACARRALASSASDA